METNLGEGNSDRPSRRTLSTAAPPSESDETVTDRTAGLPCPEFRPRVAVLPEDCCRSAMRPRRNNTSPTAERSGRRLLTERSLHARCHKPATTEQPGASPLKGAR